MSEFVFEVTQEPDGIYVAETLGKNIVTQADTWEELGANARDAVKAYFLEEKEMPAYLRLHFERDEVLVFP